VQRPRGPERDLLGALDGEGLGRELAEHRVQRGDHEERERDGDGVGAERRTDSTTAGR
jgi:hypothetical protein